MLVLQRSFCPSGITECAALYHFAYEHPHNQQLPQHSRKRAKSVCSSTTLQISRLKTPATPVVQQVPATAYASHLLGLIVLDIPAIHLVSCGLQRCDKAAMQLSATSITMGYMPAALSVALS